MLDDDPSLRRDRRSTSNDYRSTRTDWLSSPRRLVFPRRETLPYVFPCFYFVHLLIKQGDDLTAHITRSALPLPASYEAEAPRSITSEEKEFSAFRTLRIARADQRNSLYVSGLGDESCVYYARFSHGCVSRNVEISARP
jgi:hypothetical protein